MSNTIPKNLQNAFANKTLIPLVGAGVSMSLKSKSGGRLFPSWPELLECAAERLSEENKENYAVAIRGALGVNDYQGAADYARKGLTGALWNQFFKENFSIKKDDIDVDTLLLPSSIWDLSERIITLNYDRVMRFACPTPDDVLELDNTTKGELADFKSNNNKPTVWHLHGKIDNLEKLILTSESYSKLYADNDPDYRAAIAMLQSLCSSETLIFIGCSLDDAELLQQISTQHEIFAGNTGPHYALVREADRLAIQAKLAGLSIELVGFADFGEPLLEIIAAISAPSHKSTDSIEPSLKPVNSTGLVESSKKRIAIFTANPIGENYDYASYCAEFDKLNCEIIYYPLTLKALNDLEGVDYIFILSKLIKNNLVIEDDSLQSARCKFKELEDNIGNSNTKGLFIFLDHATKEDFSGSDIAADIATLKLPTLIFPGLNKAQLNSFYFQYFRKNNTDYISDAIIANRDEFSLSELKGDKKHSRIVSPLARGIDPKNTKQYIGRKTDLQNICRNMVELQSVDEILTLKGSGGIGKTATVKKIAVALAERNLFAGGIDFIDCEFITDYSGFEKKLAGSFNFENALNIPEQLQTLQGKQHKLIILDNVETLLHLPDAQHIKDFIYTVCDFASIVITSRELLGLSCERVIELSRYSTDDAYALFIKCLRREVADTSEQHLIRQDIVETLLDNNPLAIKLVASNLPSSKDMRELKQELEEDIFSKANADDLALLDAPSDTNIERKKSLYASINFSYKHLSEDEKKAFEILSLFPDGVDKKTLENIADNRNNSLRKPSTEKTKKLLTKAPVIRDSIIKSLENKSIIQVDNTIIRLQSIMGKFAEQQLHKRKPNELAIYYRRASEHHIRSVDYLYDWKATVNSYRASALFNEQQANFFKSIDYMHAANLPIEILLVYLYRLGWLSIEVSLCAQFTSALINSEAIKSQFTNDDSICLFELIILRSEYYAGSFSQAFAALKKKIPLSALLNYAPSSSLQYIIQSIAGSIYGMEGEAILELKSCTNNLSNYFGAYPDPLYHLGEINSALVASCKASILTLEAKFALGMLDSQDINDLLHNTYEGDHLGLMELYYLKTKLNVNKKENIDKQLIQNLVIVNPYTLGLQQLMLAFISEVVEDTIALYEQALKNLMHIKYYFVEALLHYARYLKEQSHAQFTSIYQQGCQLACKHHYRWLQYEFEGIQEAKTKPYNPADYPLPEPLDIDGYIKFLIKQNQKA